MQYYIDMKYSTSNELIFVALISWFCSGKFCAGIDFHVFQHKSNCNWNIFDKRYHLCEVEFIRRGFIKLLR